MIKIKNLYKEFDKNTRLLFKDYIFEDGKTYVITGPSGCGKSTLLNLISGIISPSEGDIIFKDGDIEKNISAMSQKQKDNFRFNEVGYIFQDFKLVDEFTVMDNLLMLNINGKKYTTSDVIHAMSKTHIDAKSHQKVKYLSGGEKQRVAIARAIVKKSNLVLADEPTESLNETLSHEIIDLLTSVAKKENKTLIMVTHDNSLVKYFDVHINISDFLKEGN